MADIKSGYVVRVSVIQAPENSGASAGYVPAEKSASTANFPSLASLENKVVGGASSNQSAHAPTSDTNQPSSSKK